jgi:NTP pyrophosphatase (non-canonical NTP hydrolase)
MNTDQHTSVAELKAWVRQFVEEREWQPFHDPKNLAMSIAIEAAELMEHFQWLRTEQLPQLTQDPQLMAEIREEVADILCYVLSFASALDMDLTAALHDKMGKNRRKYPAEKFKGRYRAD